MKTDSVGSRALVALRWSFVLCAVFFFLPHVGWWFANWASQDTSELEFNRIVHGAIGLLVLPIGLSLIALPGLALFQTYHWVRYGRSWS